jgi:SOS response regulatory protein OraA/RecX
MKASQVKEAASLLDQKRHLEKELKTDLLYILKPKHDWNLGSGVKFANGSMTEAVDDAKLAAEAILRSRAIKTLRQIDQKLLALGVTDENT